MLTLEQQNYAYFAYQETIKEIDNKKLSDVPKFGEFSSMYVFSNENIKDYLNELNIYGKNVLTVASSGDHFINLILMGAKKIDNFDINRNCSFMIQLKIAALKTLNYEEYLDFFSKNEKEDISITETTDGVKNIDYNSKSFDYKTYLKIRVKLPDEFALYWDMIYEEYGFLGNKLRDSKILIGCSRESAIRNNKYLEEEINYNLTVEKINNLEYKFHYKSVLDLHELKDKYDIILLSNIYSYLDANKTSDNEFVKYITSELSDKLNPEGIISFAYQFDYSNKDQNFNSDLFKKLLIPSVKKTALNDCVYIYQNNSIIE